MGLLSKLTGALGSGLGETAKGIADAVDVFVETPEEKTAFKTVMARMAQAPGLAQVELNKIGAAHRNLFVAGWRPAVGWVCAVGLAFSFLVNPVIQWWTGTDGPVLPLDIMLELVIGMLGLAGLRTVEKLTGRSK